MSRTNRKYEVRPLSCDWALDIPLGDTTVVLYFNSRNNAELGKDILEWEDAHPNEAIPYQPTLTPPNEPLTIEQLREMDGEPVWIVDIGSRNRYGSGWAIVDRDNCLVRTVKYWNPVFFEKYGERWLAYRRPPERQGGDADHA